MTTENLTGSGAAASAEKAGKEADSKKPIALIMVNHRFAASFIAVPLPQASPHFLTTRIDYRLFAALVLSLSLHLLPLLENFNFFQPIQLPAPMVNVKLRVPAMPPAPAATPPLTLPEPGSAAAPKSTPKTIPAPKTAAKSAPQKDKTWTQTVREHLKKLDAAGQFYPAEAIAQGLEGEVQVLLIIDEEGVVRATRVEHSSGYAILDAAAQRAVRSLKPLPADAPRQFVLPVRFRLK